ncbi:hypothetical protein Trichorick_01470 (plasmid) [Candidatus Trichorickettsia mobilis]|uniref:Uncharacterized protein n=1 Tax=Candidatus Trichorickettsia mobilis TaxID=1346319 RepID=A0ABZ0UWS6_9RICK|nr:hypothetical protein [Candidatus Trichorickettsia mobilis]WPY01557.1 hypothetical protein Trichorick_01470 [Candidatus Trichorickettsia mobilis]
MFFYRAVLVYLLLLTSYIAYIISNSTTDKLHASALFLSSITSFIGSVIVGLVKDAKSEVKSEVKEVDACNDIDDISNI